MTTGLFDAIKQKASAAFNDCKDTYEQAKTMDVRAICAAMKDGDTCVIKELVTAFPGEEERIAASVGKHLGCERTVYQLPSGSDGEPYLAALPGVIPADTVWNFTFD